MSKEKVKVAESEGTKAVLACPWGLTADGL